MTNLTEPSILEGATRLFIYGASGHGKVVAEIALALGHSVSGFIDDAPSMTGEHVLELPVCGGFEWLAGSAQYSKVIVGLGIGDNCQRYRVAQACRRLDIPLVTLVHPSALISPSAVIGNGTVVMPMAVVNAEVKIGAGVILNTGVIVEHDCNVGDFAHLSSNSTMGGAASLGTMSWLGMSAAIIHLVNVGAGSIVGAGGIVIHDLPDNVVAVGVPARICHRAVYAEELAKHDNNK
jgi:sugar O-acyltransferase (sialic acid O-acetyltransferase NeuD family)